MAFCSNCGKQLTSGTAFCPNCGSKVAGGSTNTGSAPQGGYQSSYAAQPEVAAGPVKTDRSLFMYIVLSVITCGIYGWYFIYKLAQDTNKMCAGDGERTAGLGMYILLSIITCGFYSIYWLYKIQDRFQDAGMRYGVMIRETGTTVVLWCVVGSLLCGLGSFIAINIVITSANQIATAYNMKYVYNR